MAVATFTLAVERQGKKNEADFIWCVAFKRGAELLQEYVSKGDRIAIIGHWYAESYQDNNGHWKNMNKCVVEKVEFLETKKTSQPPTNSDCEVEGYMYDLPF